MTNKLVIEIIKLPTRCCLLGDQSWPENFHILWSDGNHFPQQQGCVSVQKEESESQNRAVFKKQKQNKTNQKQRHW